MTLPPQTSVFAHASSLAYDDTKMMPEASLLVKKRRNYCLKIPATTLRNGVNVLCLEVHAPVPVPARYKAPGAPRFFHAHSLAWNTCGLVSIELRGNGAVESAVERPQGLQVWNENTLTRISAFSGFQAGRMGLGDGRISYHVAGGWGNPAEPPVPVKLVGARNGVFTAQVGVGSDGPIKGLEATVSDLAQAAGEGRIPASAIQILYLSVLERMPTSNADPAVSVLDALSEKPPAEVPARAAIKKMPTLTPRGSSDDMVVKGVASMTWLDGGADAPIWIKVRVPADAPAGDYQGTLTIRATGSRPVAVPVQLRVADWTLPDPKDFVTHVGAIQSPDTLALKYKVPLWSDAHFKLMEKSYSYMSEIGGKVAYIYLINGTWLRNRETMVYWVKQADGSYKYDFRVFDRYMDLVQKYLKPEAVCLYVFHYENARKRRKDRVSVLDPASGQISSLETPEFKPTPEAAAFWKPVVTEANARLQKRGLGGKVFLGVDIDGTEMPPVMELFKGVWPEGKWLQLSHWCAGVTTNSHGYVMAVFGNSTPYRSKLWGAADLPLILIKHFRSDYRVDLRPTMERGPLLWAAEVAMGGPDERGPNRGIGPLGVDFWNLTAEERGDPPQKDPGPLEGGHWSHFMGPRCSVWVG